MFGFGGRKADDIDELAIEQRVQAALERLKTEGEPGIGVVANIDPEAAAEASARSAATPFDPSGDGIATSEPGLGTAAAAAEPAGSVDATVASGGAANAGGGAGDVTHYVVRQLAAQGTALDHDTVARILELGREFSAQNPGA